MTAGAELRAAVEAWIADDPDAGDRAELQALLDRAFPGAGGGRMLAMRMLGRWANCGTGSRTGCISGRLACAAWSPRGRTG